MAQNSKCVFNEEFPFTALGVTSYSNIQWWVREKVITCSDPTDVTK